MRVRLVVEPSTYVLASAIVIIAAMSFRAGRIAGAYQSAGPCRGPQDQRLSHADDLDETSDRGAFVLALVAVGLVWFAWPRPIPVDLATVSKRPMEVTVDDEGKTRVRHIYTVSAPIAGKVLRISHPFGDHGTSIHVGDQVKAAETVVAVMQPTAPSFLDVRSREELQAMLTAADAAVTLAEAEVRRIEAALEFSRSELRRSEALARTDSIPERSLEKARFDVATNEAALASAKAQHDVRRSERASCGCPSHQSYDGYYCGDQL